MAQYCRYCSFCCYGDCAYCTLYDKVLSDKMIKSVNHCKEFSLCPVGDVLSGRQYRPREKKNQNINNCDQLSIYDMMS